MRFPFNNSSLIKQEQQLFLGVFLIALILQILARSAGIGAVDRIMWANEIKYFLNHDPLVFDFHAAYGHPGTTLLGIGCLLRISFGLSYITALNWAVSILIAAATAACSVLCFLLCRNSKWWLTTASVLLFNRMYIEASPPTAVEMPLIVLIVLYSWWLLEQKSITGICAFCLLGVIFGLAAATRLDATIFVSSPLLLLLLHRHGSRIILPTLIGSGVSFFIFDPFLWFMPIQHLSDLVHKFIIHYTNSAEIPPVAQEPVYWINYTWLAAISFGWTLALLKNRRLGKIIPSPLIFVFIGISLVAVLGIFTSNYKSVRYLLPINIVWEMLLPLFAFKTLLPAIKQYPHCQLDSQANTLLWGIVVFFILIQLLAYLTLI